MCDSKFINAKPALKEVYLKFKGFNEHNRNRFEVYLFLKVILCMFPHHNFYAEQLLENIREY